MAILANLVSDDTFEGGALLDFYPQLLRRLSEKLSSPCLGLARQSARLMVNLLARQPVPKVITMSARDPCL